MRKNRLALFGAVALSLVAIGAPAAQQPEDRGNNGRKPPKQTPDRGIDDPAPVAVDRRTGERNVEGVTIVQRPGGIVMGILDESFEDALVATVKPDGSIVYTCVHGLPAGAKHVETKAPIVSVTPAAEEK
jgi:hypothetical protein